MARKGRMSNRDIRKLCAQLVKSGTTYRSKKACVRKFKRIDRGRGRAAYAKIRSCAPSDKGIKSVQREIRALENAINRPGSDVNGRAEMWSAMLEHHHNMLVKRCGYKRASALYRRA